MASGCKLLSLTDGTRGQSMDVKTYTWGARKFCDIPDTYIESAVKDKEPNENGEKLFDYIERNCLGRDFEFLGPFGKRKGLSL